MPIAKALPKNCVCCGCYFSALKWMPSRKRYVSASAPKTCSTECQREWNRTNPIRRAKISAAFSGDKHWNWKGGSRDITHRGPGWKQARKRALERDGFQCVDCAISDEVCLEKYGRRLDVDHVEPFHNFQRIEDANRLGNLRSRCASCHRKAEIGRVVQMSLPGVFGRGHRLPARGEKVNTAKLTAEQVRLLKLDRLAGASLAVLAAKYGIAKSSTAAIVHGRAWAHVVVKAAASSEAGLAA